MMEFKYISKKRISGKFVIGTGKKIHEVKDNSTEFIHYKGIPTIWCHVDFLFNEDRFEYDINSSSRVKETLEMCEIISQSELLREIYGFTDN
jgi:hypothetical protein